MVLSLAVLIFGSGYKLGEYNVSREALSKPLSSLFAASKSKNTKNLDFTLFWETWDKVEQKYVDKKKVDPKKMFYGAIRGMVASVDDPYTFFLTPDENKQSKDDLGGRFEGIGAQLGMQANRIVVIAPLKNSPAAQAGIKTGDVIIKVNGESTKNWTLPFAVSKIRGPQGSKVKLALQRGDKQIDVTLTREQIQVDSVELSYESRLDCKSSCPKVAVIKINQFGETTNEEWDRSVEEVAGKWKSGQVKGLVLDLRGNPGGFLDSAVYLASDFLKEGELVVKQESIENSKEYNSQRFGRLLNIPLTVIINRGSASASEILSGALRDHKKAKLIGEKSFGKGSVQEALDLSDGAGLHVTVAKWILPNGDWINGKGIEAQIPVQNKAEEGNTLTRERDTQLERAIQEVLK